jgi:hypothetical protein
MSTTLTSYEEIDSEAYRHLGAEVLSLAIQDFRDLKVRGCIDESRKPTGKTWGRYGTVNEINTLLDFLNEHSLDAACSHFGINLNAEYLLRALDQ